MARKLLIGFGIFVIVATAITFYIGYKYLNPSGDYIIEHFNDNPNSSSITLFYNDQALIMKGSQLSFPLGSTSQLMVGIAYMRKIVEGEVQSSEMVSLSEINLYHFEKLDGGAHRLWLEDIKEKYGADMDSVSMDEIAKGMIKYGSMANSTYLISRISVEYINQTIQNSGISEHSPMYYIGMAALIPNLIDSNIEQPIAYIAQLSNEEYRELAKTMYEKLTNGGEEYKKTLVMPNFQLQQVWSDRLPQSSTLEYAQLMNDVIHDRRFRADESKILKDILNWPMEYQSNRDRFLQLGAKGGSTLYVLTEAIYTEDKKGNKLAFAIFFKDLGPMSATKVQKALPLFEQSLLESQGYRQNVVNQVKK